MNRFTVTQPIGRVGALAVALGIGVLAGPLFGATPSATADIGQSADAGSTASAVGARTESGPARPALTSRRGDHTPPAGRPAGEAEQPSSLTAESAAPTLDIDLDQPGSRTAHQSKPQPAASAPAINAERVATVIQPAATAAAAALTDRGVEDLPVLATVAPHGVQTAASAMSAKLPDWLSGDHAGPAALPAIGSLPKRPTAIKLAATPSIVEMVRSAITALLGSGTGMPAESPLSWMIAAVTWRPGRAPKVAPSAAVASSAIVEPKATVAASPKPAAAQPVPSLPSYRSIDGTGNSLTKPELNATGADYIRLGVAHFSDGISALRTDLPNTRTISNLVVAGSGEVVNAEGLSGMMYAWGQFIDHDINLTLSDNVTHIDIPVPAGDAVLTGSIQLTRAVTDPKTGTAGKPAVATNNVTGWMDGSMVYGSDAATAASLRGSGGKMLTSTGDNLPIVAGAFVAGDSRVAENPDLTALQTLFVREHNRQVDLLKTAHPDWTGDQLYNQARAIVTAEIEHITYNEFLPHLLGPNAIQPYQGYKPNADARISEEFAGAAYRLGHSIVSANLSKTDERGNLIGTAVSLKNAFFTAPADFIANDGADGLLRHLTNDQSNALDVHIVDDLRNFLFGTTTGMDLAAINLQRGRDLGLGTLNETRQALGLKPYTSFSQITSDPTTAASLKAAYGSVDNVELWIGGLAEDHLAGAMVGQTFNVIIARQFANLRDGDRLWYQNQGFDPATLKQIESTTLSSVILNNTDTKHMQPDAFVYYERRSGAVGGGVMQNPLSPQLVIGSNGGDTLIGGAKNDMLVAGGGQQTLTGAAGADRFIVPLTGVNAVITDFKAGQDRLQFENLGSGFKITNDRGNAVVTLGGSKVTLTGVAPSSLSPGDIVAV